MSNSVQSIITRLRSSGFLNYSPRQIRRAQCARVVWIALFAWCLGLTSAMAAETAEAPFRIQQGGTPIECNETPFGNRIPIGIDQEVLVTLQSRSGGLARNYQLSGDLVLERSADPLVDVLGNAIDLKTAPVDLNGDGLEELVVVSETSMDSIGVSVLRRDPLNPDNNEQTGSYEWTLNSPISFEIIDFTVTAADLDGSRDGREEIVIAMLYRTVGSSGRIRVIALSGDDNGNIEQASESAMATFLQDYDDSDLPFSTGTLQIAADDFLLEGRDQVILYYDGGVTLLRTEGSAEGENPSMTFSGRSFLESSPPIGQCSATPEIHVGDFGGSAAREIVVHEKSTAVTCSAESLKQRIISFTTDRDENDQIIDYALNSTPPRAVPNSNTGFFAASAGEMDRVPGEEIVLAWQQSDDANTLRVEMFRVDFDQNGLPTGIGPTTPATFASIDPGDFGLVLSEGLDIVVGDAEGDAIGDVYLTSQTSNNDVRIPRLFKFAMTRPGNPNQFPDVTTFQLVDEVSLPPMSSANASFINEIQLADWDNDSVLGDLGTTCVRVQEPQIRTVVKLPPYWERLQANASGFDAGIGNSNSSGSSDEQNYDTFSSSDISGYVGLQAGGSVFGIGVSTTVKATAGKNEQVSNGETRTETELTTTTQFQNQDAGEGLVAVENNTYRCYTYNVTQGGLPAEDSSLRACELLRRDDGGTPLRSFITSDLDTWDTTTGDGNGGNTPAQWAPLHPDWASQALFHPVTTNITPINGSSADAVVDGLFDTALESDPSTSPYVEIDLGGVQEISNIRVFPQTGGTASLIGFNLYASAAPFQSVGGAPPTGPGVQVFEPDPATRNGVDRWNIRTRGSSPDFALMKARYIRLQHPGAARLRVAEIQVFGDVYLEPPAYPLSVCDPVANDGIFLARVADLVAPTPVFRNVQVRGDLSWTGGFNNAGCGTNYEGLPGGNGVGDNFSIWEGVQIVGSGANSWSLDNAQESAYGLFNSVSHSSRIGAEVEIEVGPVVAGSAYSFESGVTRENSSTMFWGQSLQYTGGVGGFKIGSNPACGYFPRPYSYVTTERSNVGYTHQYTVVDYVVTENLNSWSRLGPNFPPPNCFIPPDSLFLDRFEAAIP